jgi:hypothetical protein
LKSYEFGPGGGSGFGGNASGFHFKVTHVATGNQVFTDHLNMTNCNVPICVNMIRHPGSSSIQLSIDRPPNLVNEMQYDAPDSPSSRKLMGLSFTGTTPIVRQIKIHHGLDGWDLTAN